MNAPKYVMLEGIALRREGSTYYRDAGNWSVAFDERTLKIDEPSIKHLHGKQLVECTEEEWRESNKGYV